MTSNNLKFSSTKGSSLIIVLLITFGISLLAGTYLSMVGTNYKASVRLFCTNQAVNLSEAGIEEALSELQKELLYDSGFSYSRGWRSIDDNTYYLRTSHLVSYMNKTKAEIRVLISGVGTKNPVIFSEAHVVRGPVETTKQLKIKLGNRGLFSTGLLAKDSIVFNGNKTYVDSYNSNDGPYSGPDDAGWNYNDKGSVASTSVELSSVNIGNADILGYVATGGSEPSIGPNGTITGFDTPYGVDVDLNRVTTDFVAEFPTISYPDTTWPNTSYSSNIGVLGLTTYYELNSFSGRGKNTYNIRGNVVMIVKNDMTLSGKSQLNITPGSSLTVYLDGNLDLGGKGVINTEQIPSDLMVYGMSSSTKTYKVSGNGQFYGVIYAPNANVALKGSGSSGVVQGAIIAKTIKLTGNFNFHYDEALEDLKLDDKPTMLEWVEIEFIVDRANLLSQAKAATWHSNNKESY